MATVKHIAIRNSNYSATTDYLTMQHNEFTNKPILDQNGEMIPRDFYLMDAVNCNVDTFEQECQSTNAHFGRNREYQEIKAHHYIVSFDPDDVRDNNLTPEKAQQLGMELARKEFPGHQTIVCTHKDGHNGTGNIHCHIVINSVRKLTTDVRENQERRYDNIAGYKHRDSVKFLRDFKSTVMEICQREGLYQVDLLSPARVRITDREYWAQRRGQAKLDQDNTQMIASGKVPDKTVYETKYAILRRQIKSVMEDSHDFEEFREKLLGQYGILVDESRGRINYLPPDRTKPIRGRTLGTDFEKEYIEEYFRHKSAIHQNINESKIVKLPAIENAHLSLIVQLQIIVDEQAKPYLSQDMKIRNLKDMAQTLAFCQENHIDSKEELEALLDATHEDYVTKKNAHANTTAELKNAREILRLTKQRHANKNTYLEFMNARNKAKFRRAHETEIILYETATRELKRLLDGKPIPYEKKTMALIHELSQKKNQEYEELSEINRREKVLRNSVNNVRDIYKQS